MSFKREGNDKSQLNILKVTAFSFPLNLSLKWCMCLSLAVRKISNKLRPSVANMDSKKIKLINTQLVC